MRPCNPSKGRQLHAAAARASLSLRQGAGSDKAPAMLRTIPPFLLATRRSKARPPQGSCCARESRRSGWPSLAPRTQTPAARRSRMARNATLEKGWRSLSQES
eukprot:2605152-Prymnesium_polylepis.3